MLLPAPFGPIRQRNSPSASAKSTLRTAWTPPKCLVRPRVSISGGVHARRPCGRLGSAAAGRRSVSSHGIKRSVITGAMPFGTSNTKTSRMAPSTHIRIDQLLGTDFDRRPGNRNRAKHRAEQRAGTADHQPDDDLRGLDDAEHGRADVVSPRDEQASGEAREPAADRKRDELMQSRVVAEKFNAPFILAHGDKDASEPRRQQRVQTEIDQQQQDHRQHEHILRLERVVRQERNVE